ncbi:MAG: SH3-like domain-containing protein [Gracilimonas sp.]|uniref:SH3-like domain-containing protein n=1 Tax=Gracilimonas sp. TaxID=1974203 RepID=UPI00199596CA|nr:SH3-like domain-containing protein [Gracilimonas sp.]MBD3617488.1 SH3-like domain-containing protein [Gracilimonas sp.]
MKGKIFLVLFLLFCGHKVTAQQVTFDQANTLFENGELNEAMALYKSIESSGQISGALFLNMGITAVQLDSMGLAKYYFLRAQDFETTRDRSVAALEYVNNQFSRQSAVLPKLPWDRAIEWINDKITAYRLFICGFLVTLSGLVLLYLGWMNTFSLQKTFSYILTLIIVGTAIAGLAFYADYVNQRYDEAVLISTSQRVLENPNPESPLISIAYEGYDLTVDHWKTNEHENWLYIRLGNGQFGWIQNEGIKIL